MTSQCLGLRLNKSFFVYFLITYVLNTFCFALTGAEDSESCENRNGAASALLHIDESEGMDDIGRQRNKSKRRSEHRQVQTGKIGNKLSIK